MAEMSIFIDESGETGTESKYYILTLVFHEQSDDINGAIHLYESALEAKRLPNIPFHASPLINGHKEYKDLDIHSRKMLLQSFFTMLQHLPIKYKTLTYRKSEFEGAAELTARMKRDIMELMFENLSYLQRFDKVKIYYDNGQTIVTRALHDAAEYALSTDAIVYRTGSPREYRLSQTADFTCTLELTALKYSAKEHTNTDALFFGEHGSFKKNYLKKIRRKML